MNRIIIDGLLLNGPLGTNFMAIWMKIRIFLLEMENTFENVFHKMAAASSSAPYFSVSSTTHR